MRLPSVLALCIIAATASALAEPSRKETFDKAIAEAKANRKTPAGQAYDRTLSAYFEQNAGPLMRECFESVKEPDAAPFEMVFTLSLKGAVRAVLVWPETNISTCFRDKLGSRSLPVPPKDKYLAYMEMRFGP